MARRFNPAPGWPVPPSGWTPPPGWKPDPAWPPAPAGWQFWVEDIEPAAPPSTAPPATGAASTGAAASAVEPDQAPADGAAPAPGWEPPEPAGPGFTGWVRDHKLISAAVVVLVVVLGGYWTFGSDEPADRIVGGVSEGDRGWGSGSGNDDEPPPTNAFRTKTAALTAAINAALDAPLPTPSASAAPTTGSLPSSGPTLPSASPSASPSAPPSGADSHGVSVEALGRDGTPIRVFWSIDGGLTGVAAKDAARADAVKILSAVKATADYGYSKVVLIGMFPAGGPGTPQQRVVEATYQKPTVDRLDFATVDPRQAFELGDGPAFLDPSMRY